MKLGAVILCGGQSRRMGRSKAWLSFGGESLLQRVVRLISTAVEHIAVVAAPGQQLPALPASVILTRDPVHGKGPLQGLAAGLSALPDEVEFVYATATDVPFLHPEWIGRLVALIGEHDLAIPMCDGYHHPLAALYRRRTVLPAILGLLDSDRLRPVFLMETVSTRLVVAAELREIDPELGTLRNLNTPEDYEAALRDDGLASAQATANVGDAGLCQITIELFGVPRLRAGVARLKVEAATVGDALLALGRAAPALVGTVLDGEKLHPAYTLSLNGDRFITDLCTPLSHGDSLLLLAVDVGG
jgi:molybdopterin-guanine dinucleotide biosynthesis protein A